MVTCEVAGARWSSVEMYYLSTRLFIICVCILPLFRACRYYTACVTRMDVAVSNDIFLEKGLFVRAAAAMDEEVDGESELRFVQAVSDHFRGFSEDECTTLAAAMSILTFQKGEQIIAKGEIATWFGVLLRGSLSVTNRSAHLEPRQAGTKAKGQTALTCSHPDASAFPPPAAWPRG